MNLRELDEALDHWNARLAAAAQNVMDLQAHPTYRKLAAMDGSLSGKTADEASIAVNTVARLLECYELLQHTIGRAEEMRRNLPVISFSAEQRLAEIKAVLEGMSVQMPARQIPLEKRGLLGSIEQVDRMTPAGLLDVMSKAFEEAKAKVLAIDGAYEALGRGVESEERRLRLLENESVFLTEPEAASLRSINARLEQFKTQAASDPLTTTEWMSGQVTALLNALAQTVAQRKQRRAQAENDMRRAARVLDEVNEAGRVADETNREAALKIESFGAVAALQAREIDGLSDWLERLRKKANQGAWEAVGVGIRNWVNAAQTIILSLKRATEKARSALDLRAELRGRMDAFRAKARAFQVAEETELSAASKAAQGLLDAKPCSLEAAARSVGEYEVKLNAKLNSAGAKNVGS